MGCDIHTFIEYKKKDSDRWMPLGGHLRLDRHYGVFGRIAGVRCDGCLIEPRGIPDDLSYESEPYYWLRVDNQFKDDDGYCSTEQALSWIKYGSRVKLKENREIDRVEHPDYHTPTWLTASELEACLVDMHDTERYTAVVAALRSFEQQGFDSRLIIFFDN